MSKKRVRIQYDTGYHQLIEMDEIPAVGDSFTLADPNDPDITVTYRVTGVCQYQPTDIALMRQQADIQVVTL